MSESTGKISRSGDENKPQTVEFTTDAEAIRALAQQWPNIRFCRSTWQDKRGIAEDTEGKSVRDGHCTVDEAIQWMKSNQPVALLPCSVSAVVLDNDHGAADVEERVLAPVVGKARICRIDNPAKPGRFHLWAKLGTNPDTRQPFTKWYDGDKECGDILWHSSRAIVRDWVKLAIGLLERDRDPSGESLSFDALAPLEKPKRKGKGGKGKPEASPEAVRVIQCRNIESALGHIDPSDESTWWKVGNSLHSFTAGSDAGLALFDQWSKGTARGNYEPNAVQRKWQGFPRADSLGPNASYRHIVKLGREGAKAAGADWEPEPIPGEAAGLGSEAMHFRFMEEGAGEGWAYLIAGAGNGAGTWARWTGHHWQDCKTVEHYAAVTRFVRDVRRTLLPGEERKAGWLREPGFAPAVAQFNARSLYRRIEGMDADADVLNTPAGVVDLRTGELAPHDKPGPFRKVTGVAPDWTMPTPVWDRCLHEWCGHHDGLPEFVTRLMGYALRGDNREHRVVFVTGPGGNGKGAWLRVLESMLGSYGRKADDSVFIRRRNDEHKTALAGLHGARTAYIDETEEGAAWNESRLKAVSGGDTVTARFMRGDFFDFRPAFLPLIVGNFEPSLQDVGPSMRRRLLLIPFDAEIAEPDTDLDRKLKPELPGILARAIDGHVQWLQGGLAAPSIVRSETADYFSENDTMGRYLSERVTILDRDALDGSGGCPASKVYNDYRIWAIDENGSRFPWSAPTFGARLKKRGVPWKRKSAGIVYALMLGKVTAADSPIMGELEAEAEF